MEKILGRALSSTEIGRVLAWLSDYGASPKSSCLPASIAKKAKQS